MKTRSSSTAVRNSTTPARDAQGKLIGKPILREQSEIITPTVIAAIAGAAMPW